MMIADAVTTPAAPIAPPTSRSSACRPASSRPPSRTGSSPGSGSTGRDRRHGPPPARLRWPASTGRLDLVGELALALELADVADAITLPRFRSSTLRVDHKADRTEVTVADRSSEAAIRPADRRAAGPRGARRGGGPHRPPGATARWIVDPIDGTSNYVRGIPDLGDADRPRARRRARGRGRLGARLGPALVGGQGSSARSRTAIGSGSRRWPTWPRPISRTATSARSTTTATATRWSPSPAACGGRGAGRLLDARAGGRGRLRRRRRARREPVGSRRGPGHRGGGRRTVHVLVRRGARRRRRAPARPTASARGGPARLRA